MWSVFFAAAVLVGTALAETPVSTMNESDILRVAAQIRTNIGEDSLPCLNEGRYTVAVALLGTDIERLLNDTKIMVGMRAHKVITDVLKGAEKRPVIRSVKRAIRSACRKFVREQLGTVHDYIATMRAEEPDNPVLILEQTMRGLMEVVLHHPDTTDTELIGLAQLLHAELLPLTSGGNCNRLLSAENVMAFVLNLNNDVMTSERIQTAMSDLRNELEQTALDPTVVTSLVEAVERVLTEARKAFTQTVSAIQELTSTATDALPIEATLQWLVTTAKTGPLSHHVHGHHGKPHTHHYPHPAPVKKRTQESTQSSEENTGKTTDEEDKKIFMEIIAALNQPSATDPCRDQKVEILNALTFQILRRVHRVQVRAFFSALVEDQTDGTEILQNVMQVLEPGDKDEATLEQLLNNLENANHLDLIREAFMTDFAKFGAAIQRFRNLVDSNRDLCSPQVGMLRPRFVSVLQRFAERYRTILDNKLPQVADVLSRTFGEQTAKIVPLIRTAAEPFYADERRFIRHLLTDQREGKVSHVLGRYLIHLHEKYSHGDEQEMGKEMGKDE